MNKNEKIKLVGTCQQFDDFWNDEIGYLFRVFETDVLEELDLSQNSIYDLKEKYYKMTNEIYGKLDEIFDNNWKYLVRSEERND